MTAPPQERASAELSSGVGRDVPRHARLVNPFAVFFLFLLIYAMSAAPAGGWGGAFARDEDHLYLLQIDAWKNGRLSLDPARCGQVDVTWHDGKPFCSFPPGPALLWYVPAVIFGSRFSPMAAQIFMAALGVMFMYGTLLAANDRYALRLRPATAHLLVALYGLGTLIWPCTVTHGVWYSAHAVATGLLPVALWATICGLPTVAGFAWGFAAASRPTVLFALVALAIIAWGNRRASRSAMPAAPRSAGRTIGVLLRFALFPLLIGAFVGWHNHARFGSATEMGYGKMSVDAALAAERDAHGAFDWNHVRKNVRTLILKPPKLIDAPPFLISDGAGMGLFWCTPAFLYIFFARRVKPLTAACCLGVIAVAVPNLMYFNTGWVQWGCRFFLDFHPFLLVLTALAVGRRPSGLFHFAVAASILSNLAAVAYQQWR